jgi:hypothetical protein
MAGLSVTDVYDALLSTTLRNWSKKLRDNIFDDFPTLNWLRMKGRVNKQNGGTYIMEHLLYEANSTIAAYAGEEHLSTVLQEGITVAQYKWKEYGGTIGITRAERRKNSGKHAMINLLQAKATQAELSMKNTLTTDLFADIAAEPSKAITGFFLHANDSPSTTTVGELAGATYSWWRNHAADVGAYGTYLHTKMRTAYNTCSAGGADFPDGIACTQTAYEYYEGLGANTSLKRFVDEKATLDMGFEVLRYKGAQIWWDAGMATGVPATGETMLFLNSKNIRLVVDSETDLITTDFLEPVNQTVSVAKILWMLNLVNNNRRKLGVIHGIDAS